MVNEKQKLKKSKRSMKVISTVIKTYKQEDKYIMKFITSKEKKASSTYTEI